ncbi:MAG: hypothetical protein JOZ07_13810 [Solirubrobacterales bacterium]|nr:hypothetical protein [Solirubrobacterales bacterium]
MSSPPPAPRHSAWERRARELAHWIGHQLRAPRPRLALLGIVFILLGALWVTNSAWTLPLIVVGIVMVVVAWVGSRLEGRFVVQWGDGATQVEFHAKVKPSPYAELAAGPVQTPAPPTRPELEDADVIDGEGHTVEIDVAKLRTLIAAAEAKEAAERATAERAAAERAAVEAEEAAVESAAAERAAVEAEQAAVEAERSAVEVDGGRHGPEATSAPAQHDRRRAA